MRGERERETETEETFTLHQKRRPPHTVAGATTGCRAPVREGPLRSARGGNTRECTRQTKLMPGREGLTGGYSRVLAGRSLFGHRTRHASTSAASYAPPRWRAARAAVAGVKAGETGGAGSRVWHRARGCWIGPLWPADARRVRRRAQEGTGGCRRVHQGGEGPGDGGGGAARDPACTPLRPACARREDPEARQRARARFASRRAGAMEHGAGAIARDHNRKGGGARTRVGSPRAYVTRAAHSGTAAKKRRLCRTGSRPRAERTQRYPRAMPPPAADAWLRPEKKKV